MSRRANEAHSHHGGSGGDFLALADSESWYGQYDALESFDEFDSNDDYADVQPEDELTGVDGTDGADGDGAGAAVAAPAAARARPLSLLIGDAGPGMPPSDWVPPPPSNDLMFSGSFHSAVASSDDSSDEEQDALDELDSIELPPPTPTPTPRSSFGSSFDGSPPKGSYSFEFSPTQLPSLATVGNNHSDCDSVAGSDSGSSEDEEEAVLRALVAAASDGCHEHGHEHEHDKGAAAASSGQVGNGYDYTDVPDGYLYTYPSGQPRLRAEYAYTGRDSTELSFGQGALITVLDIVSEEWWWCKYRGVRGFVPAAYMEAEPADWQEEEDDEHDVNHGSAHTKSGGGGGGLGAVGGGQEDGSKMMAAAKVEALLMSLQLETVGSAEA
eukprot:m.46568 g.46568  ORF g.46568 m.46568 type:complete len:384 (+) comp11869_c0_seq1:305-1456(+)